MRFSFLLLSTALILPLAACQTTSEHDLKQERSDKIGAVLERAAAQASSAGNQAESLDLLERSYKRDSDNMELATKYAHALRMAGRLTRATLVLSPFVNDSDDADTAAHTEYAAAMAAMGTYAQAEDHARRAVLRDPENGQAYHVLGISLDAQGHYKPAEVAFRKALDFWQGNPGPLLNNLGLNLATQGFLDEALDTLRKAAAVSPNRQEIERNLRIVTALQVPPPQSGFYPVPRPKHKPKYTEAAAAPVEPVEEVPVEEAGSAEEG